MTCTHCGRPTDDHDREQARYCLNALLEQDAVRIARECGGSTFAELIRPRRRMDGRER